MTHDVRCLDCGAEYTVSPRYIDVGPLDDAIVTGRDDEAPIPRLITDRLYRGAVATISCPICMLRARVAADLAPHTLRKYLEYQRNEFSGLAMDRIFESTLAVTRIREFPVSCPRCDAKITEYAQAKCCRECGAGQIQTLSRLDPESENNEAQLGPPGD